MAIEWRSVWSSHIERIGYDAEAQQMHVEYSDGPTAIYDAVTPDKWRAVNSSESIGSAMHKLIRGKHEFRYG